MRSILRTTLAALSLALPVPAFCETVKPVPLPALGADIAQTSVSGISSGAYMAGQFEIAHSKLVVGAAIIGLALTQRVVEDAHGGNLSLEPTDAGASFLIELPLHES